MCSSVFKAIILKNLMCQKNFCDCRGLKSLAHQQIQQIFYPDLRNHPNV